MEVLERQVAERRTPGAVLAVRHRGEEEVRCVGALGLEGPRARRPVTADTPLWLASLTKPVAAVLAQRVLADGDVALEDPLARWLPELAAPLVLRDPATPLSETGPAERELTVLDVLSGTAGVGIAADCFGDVPSPLFTAMLDRGVAPGPFAPDLDPDTWVARLGELPLAVQPGAQWRYHTPHDVLSVLLARASGQPLAALLGERVLAPLGMGATGFALPGAGRDDVVDVLTRDGDGAPSLVPTPDPGRGTAFPGLAAGLLSSASDLLRFATAMADGGAPVLPPGAVDAMTTGRLTPAQRAAAAPFLEPGTSWGLGVAVDVAPSEPVEQVWHSPGCWGWVGGTGTALHVDPARELVVVLLTGRFMGGPDDGQDDVWRALLGALRRPTDDPVGRGWS